MIAGCSFIYGTIDGFSIGGVYRYVSQSGIFGIHTERETQTKKVSPAILRCSGLDLIDETFKNKLSSSRARLIPFILYLFTWFESRPAKLVRSLLKVAGYFHLTTLKMISPRRSASPQLYPFVVQTETGSPILTVCSSPPMRHCRSFVYPFMSLAISRIYKSPPYQHPPRGPIAICRYQQAQV